MAISNEELRLILTARDRMSGVLSRSTRSLSAFQKVTGLAKGALGLLGKAAGIAGGIIAGALGLQALRGVSRAVGDLAKQAWDSAAAWERQEIALTALVSREVQAENARQKIISTQQIALSLTEKEEKARARAVKQLDDVNARIAIGSQRMEEYAGKKTQSEATWMSMNEAMRKNLRTRDELVATLAMLEEKEGRIVTLTKTGTEYTLTQEEAYARAAGRVAELQSWLEKLDLNSPFEEGSIQQTFRQALMFGFTTKEAQRLTVAMGDYTAATGASGVMMQRIAYNLGQIQSIGHVTGREIRDLANAGFPIVDVLANAMGVTKERLMDMVSGGLVPADKAIEAIVTTIERDFGGAMGKMAKHWTAFFTVIGKIKRIGLRKLFTPIAEAFSPTFSRIMDKLTSPEFQSRLEEIGVTMGEKIGKFLDEAPTRFEAFRKSAGEAIWDFASDLDILPESMRTVLRLIAGMVKGEFGLGIAIDVMRTQVLPRWKEDWGTFVEDAKAGWQRVKDTFEEEGFVKAFNVALDEMWALLPKGLRGAIQEFDRLWNELWLGEQITVAMPGGFEGVMRAPGLQAKIRQWGQNMALMLKEGFVGIVKDLELWIWSEDVRRNVIEKGYQMGAALARGLADLFGIGPVTEQEPLKSEFERSIEAIVEGFFDVGYKAASEFVRGFAEYLRPEPWEPTTRYGEWMVEQAQRRRGGLPGEGMPSELREETLEQRRVQRSGATLNFHQGAIIINTQEATAEAITPYISAGIVAALRAAGID